MPNMMYQCSLTAHFHVFIMYARAPHGLSGRGRGGAAESRSMQPIRGSAGKDVFCRINRKIREGWQV